MKLLVALTLAVFCSSSRQDVADGVYTNKERGLKLAVPAKGDWKLRTKEFQFGWKGAVLEISNETLEVSGALCVYDSAMKVEKFAEWREEAWKKRKEVKTIKRLKQESLERQGGNWIRSEFFMEYGEYEYHYVYVFAARGRENIELALWTSDALWEDDREAILKVADTLEIK